MIVFDHVCYQYEKTSATPILRDLCLEIEDGELVLVVGSSGAGKTTWLRCLNGLVPHFYGGSMSGRISVAGYDPVATGPQAMSHVVGMVFQDPETQFVGDRVEDELAFGMENQALPPRLMRKRVEEVLDQLSIAHLRSRYISTLSGGEKQRVAIAAVLTMHPQVLVLDEPTSQLDPQSAEEVLVAIRRLNEDLGLTVVLAEHRLERVVQFVDRVLYLPARGQEPLLDKPRSVMAQISLNPPLVSLGKVLGWQPLPLTVKEARRLIHRQKGPTEEVAGTREPFVVVARDGQTDPDPSMLSGPALARSVAAEIATLSQEASPGSEAIPALRVEDLGYSYGGGKQALRGINLVVWPGEVVALMGRNGSGKSTLLKHLVGLLKPGRGRVLITPEPSAAGPGTALDTRQASVHDIVKVVGYVPQNPDALLFRDTLLEELAFTRQGHGMPPNLVGDRRLLGWLGLADQATRYPRDLSSGQRQRAALAAILVADPQVLLLDEPTRGLDYEQKEGLTRILLGLRDQGRSVVLATHDVELAARCTDRVVLLGEGEVVVDGPTREVMTGSLVFASQVNKLYRDPRYLVVEDVTGGRLAMDFLSPFSCNS